MLGTFYLTPPILRGVLQHTVSSRYVLLCIAIIFISGLFLFFFLKIFFLLKKKSFEELFNLRFRLILAFLISIMIFFLSLVGNETKENQNIVLAFISFLDGRNSAFVEVINIVRIYIFCVYRVENLPFIVSAVFLPGIGIIRSITTELFSTGFFIGWVKQIKTPIIAPTSVSEVNMPVRSGSSTIDANTTDFINSFNKSKNTKPKFAILKIIEKPMDTTGSKFEKFLLHNRLNAVQKSLTCSSKEAYNMIIEKGSGSVHNTNEKEVSHSDIEEAVQEDISEIRKAFGLSESDVGEFIKMLFYKLLSLYHAMGHDKKPKAMYAAGKELLPTDTLNNFTTFLKDNLICTLYRKHFPLNVLDRLINRYFIFTTFDGAYLYADKGFIDTPGGRLNGINESMQLLGLEVLSRSEIEINGIKVGTFDDNLFLGYGFPSTFSVEEVQREEKGFDASVLLSNGRRYLLDCTAKVPYIPVIKNKEISFVEKLSSNEAGEISKKNNSVGDIKLKKWRTLFIPIQFPAVAFKNLTININHPLFGKSLLEIKDLADYTVKRIRDTVGRPDLLVIVQFKYDRAKECVIMYAKWKA